MHHTGIPQNHEFIMLPFNAGTNLMVNILFSVSLALIETLSVEVWAFFNVKKNITVHSLKIK